MIYKFSPDVLQANADNDDFIESFGDPKKGSNGRISDIEITAKHIMARLPIPQPVHDEIGPDPNRKWRFDFAWPEYRIAVEIEGGTRQNGRHNRHEGYKGDCRKYNAGVLNGWRILRFTSDMVTSGELAADVTAVFRNLG